MLDKSELNYLPEAKANNNVSTAEIDRFDELAEQWWDPNGSYKRVLDFNHCRWTLIQQQILSHFKVTQLTSLNALDIGCGGGLLCEPLAGLGISVTGIDASEMSVQVASRHAQQSGLNIDYRHCLSTQLLNESSRYDIVLNTEVIEHVPDQQQLLQECCELLKPGGLLILATLNRTIKSFLFGIVGAEYVLRLLPIGTHDWRAFVKPQEIRAMLPDEFTVSAERGVAFNPFTGNWSAKDDLSVNYLLFASKAPL